MQVLSFTKILEDVSASLDAKHFEGEIKQLDALLSAENAARLQERHRGLFCFLAFFPNIDRAVVDYVLSGALASDSGPKILVLFLSLASAPTPKEVSRDLVAGVDVKDAIHPAYEIVNNIFEGADKQSLPGLLIFSRLVNLPEAIYVSLGPYRSGNSVREMCQKIFVAAEKTMLDSPDLDGAFFDRLAAKLALANLTYARTARTSFREWLVRSYTFLQKHGKDLVAVIPKLTTGSP